MRTNRQRNIAEARQDVRLNGAVKGAVLSLWALQMIRTIRMPYLKVLEQKGDDAVAVWLQLWADGTANVPHHANSHAANLVLTPVLKSRVEVVAEVLHVFGEFRANGIGNRSDSEERLLCK